MTRHHTARPDRLVLVAGTATDVGKSWVCCRIAESLRAQGTRVVARKPAQSFEPGDDVADVTDAQLLAQATGDEPGAVTPPHRWYPVAMAPPMAARTLGRPDVRIDGLLSELVWPPGTQVGLLETAGGVRSPLALDGDTVVVAARLRPSLVVIVADAGLGTIGAVRGAVDALSPHPRVILLNRFDPADDLHQRNHEWLTTIDGETVARSVTELLPHVTGPSPGRAGRAAGGDGEAGAGS